jgi:hypothetical protein
LPGSLNASPTASRFAPPACRRRRSPRNRSTPRTSLRASLAPTPIVGASDLNPLRNIGSTQNSGHELSLNAQIIDRRAFSWTTLFSQFEQALPPDVRITAVQPRRERDGSFAVNIGVEARRVEDVEAFIEALEARTPFRDVLPVEEQTGDTGLIEAIIDGRYMPERPGTATAPASAPDTAASAAGKRASR